MKRCFIFPCLVWWKSGVVDVWCGGCLVWWMSGVVDVWCGGCPILHMVWWMSGVVDVWCGGCLILHTVWWMSGVVDVCVVDVVQSSKWALAHCWQLCLQGLCLGEVQIGASEGWR